MGTIFVFDRDCDLKTLFVEGSVLTFLPLHCMNFLSISNVWEEELHKIQDGCMFAPKC